MACPTDFTAGGELAHEVSPASPGHCWGEAGRAHTTLQMEVSSQQATFGRKTTLKRLTLILATMLKSPDHCLLLDFSRELRFVFLWPMSASPHAGLSLWAPFSSCSVLHAHLDTCLSIHLH